ncbi:MAG TPA: VOC family protein [Thermoanaerobaculia bacterium]|jgi:catechol 2,3-dioxygenase-like lactoylglutathione lyase family enzyme|nr:VOC family protein [Thermoanaerobaculia bacterium]
MRIHGLHHLQLAIPRGAEDTARAFYAGVLGLRETAKPPNLARRGGVWFALGALQLHLGVEDDFHPARKAHPALLVEDLAAMVERCRQAGVPVAADEPLPGFDRVYIADPFGNRIELLEPEAP